MYIENDVRPYIAVTESLVQEVAESDKATFMGINGEIKVYDVLYYLGFKIATKLYNRDVSYIPKQFVRNINKPHLVFESAVYKGRLRKEQVGYNGKNPIYRYHKMQEFYDKYGILHPSDLSKYVKSEDMINILEVGSYNE